MGNFLSQKIKQRKVECTLPKGGWTHMPKETMTKHVAEEMWEDN